jgi:hypothetical protein
MARHEKTVRLIDTAKEILSQSRPMTVRQVYYQLVSRQVVENSRSQYQAVSDALVAARKEGIIPWDWIEDRLRRPRAPSMWSDLSEFVGDVLGAYRRDVWETQPGYLEVWLEKDALSGIFEDVLANYGITLNVGRGYDGWDSIKNAAERFCGRDHATVLYFGDFDPSGEDMVRSLAARLAFFGTPPQILKCALNPDDIDRYRLPPNFTKATDTRRAKFIEKHGDRSVELDALPADVLRERLRDEIESRMDLEALQVVRDRESQEKQTLSEALDGI